MTAAELTAAREALKLRREELAAVLGVDPSSVRRWEAVGTRTAQKVPHLVALAVNGFLAGYRPPGWPPRPD
jgi:DNA-binding transcriptional regulator YiaG